MKKLRHSLVVLSLVACVACGGSTSTPIDNSNVSSSTSSSSSSSGGTSGSTTSSSSSSGSGDVDSGTKDSGGAPLPPSNPGLVSCDGPLECPTNGGAPSIDDKYCCLEEGGAGVCKAGPVTECKGTRIYCDEGADCRDGRVCCTDPINGTTPGSSRIGTSCRDTCITGAPRTQVCKTDAECKEAGGKCQAFACAGYAASLRFCSKPLDCK